MRDQTWAVPADHNEANHDKDRFCSGMEGDVGAFVEFLKRLPW